MKSILIVAVFLGSGFVFASDVHVHGYMRSNGTYVHSYERTAPNDTNLDNYSTKGNYNPYTGQKGTKTPGYGSDSSHNNNRHD